MNESFYRQLDQIYASSPQSVEEFLKKTLDSCRRDQDLNGVITVRNELGSLYRGQARYEDSLYCFQDALEKLEQLGQKDSIPYLTTLMNRAGTLRLANRAGDAVEDFLYVLSMLHQTPEDVRCLRASALNNLGLAYQSLNRLEEAEDCLTKALEIIRTLPGMTSEAAPSGNNLAALCLKQGRLEDAARWLEPAIAYYRSPEGRQDPHYPSAYATLAALRCRQDRLEEALECYDRSAAGTERFFGQNPQYAAARYDAALIAYVLKREDCASRMEEAVSLWERLQGSASPKAGKMRRLLDRLQEDMP